MENIDLSILIAVYNPGQYLSQCLESVLSQSVGNAEVIVVDDGSTDDSKEILKRYESKFKRIQIIQKRKNEGTLLTRLDGMLRAKGRYVTFIDGDDTYEPFSLHRVLDIAKEKEIDILEYEYHIINTENKNIHDPSMGRNIMPANTHITGKKQCFKLLKRAEVPLFKRIYSRRLCMKVLSYFTSFANYRERFRGILHEDEFITPLFFANARSYYCIREKIYNYRYLRCGSVTHKISQKNDRKIRSGEEYMHICESLSNEFKRKKLLNEAEYFEYNIKGINFFLFRCRECNLPLLDRLIKINKYYTFHKIIYIYMGSKISSLRLTESNK